MKKLFFMIGSIGLTLTTGVSLVGCSTSLKGKSINVSTIENIYIGINWTVADIESVIEPEIEEIDADAQLDIDYNIIYPWYLGEYITKLDDKIEITTANRLRGTVTITVSKLDISDSQRPDAIAGEYLTSEVEISLLEAMGFNEEDVIFIEEENEIIISVEDKDGNTKNKNDVLEVGDKVIVAANPNSGLITGSFIIPVLA